jgi:hypothetical protein
VSFLLLQYYSQTHLSLSLQVELEQPIVNPVPRTHNLGKEGTEWHGQPLDKELPTDSASLHEEIKVGPLFIPGCTH